jgi:hypothetical protein
MTSIARASSSQDTLSPAIRDGWPGLFLPGGRIELSEACKGGMIGRGPGDW